MEESNNNRDYEIKNFKRRNQIFTQNNFRTNKKFKSNKDLIKAISIH